MHINQDLLEACHLISAMLLEVPNMATEETSDRPRHISRYFRKHVDFMHRQVFSGPPENTRELLATLADPAVVFLPEGRHRVPRLSEEHAATLRAFLQAQQCGYAGGGGATLEPGPLRADSELNVNYR